MKELKHILLVNYEYPPLGGGGGVITRDFAETLSTRVQATVLTSGYAGLKSEEKNGNLCIIRVPVWGRSQGPVASLASMLSFFPKSLCAGHRLMGMARFDLVHSFFAIPSGPSGLLLARQGGVPHVLSVLGGDIYDPSKTLSPHRTPFLKQTVKWVINGSDRTVAESEDLVKRTRENFGTKSIDRIPLAFKPVVFRRIDRMDLGLGLRKEDIVLIAVGRLVERKGIEQLIKVLSKINDPRVQLVVVGDGPLRSKLTVQSEEAGVAKRVHFTGFVSDQRKWELLSNADLFVSTTAHEGFGIVFLEAMESGLPIVSYNCGGHVDFLTKDIAYLIPVGNISLFRETVIRLGENSDLRKRMGETAREEAKKYHIEVFTDRYVKLYQECLESHRASNRSLAKVG